MLNDWWHSLWWFQSAQETPPPWKVRPSARISDRVRSVWQTAVVIIIYTSWVTLLDCFEHFEPLLFQVPPSEPNTVRRWFVGVQVIPWRRSTRTLAFPSSLCPSYLGTYLNRETSREWVFGLFPWKRSLPGIKDNFLLPPVARYRKVKDEAMKTITKVACVASVIALCEFHTRCD